MREISAVDEAARQGDPAALVERVLDFSAELDEAALGGAAPDEDSIKSWIEWLNQLGAVRQSPGLFGGYYDALLEDARGAARRLPNLGQLDPPAAFADLLAAQRATQLNDAARAKQILDQALIEFPRAAYFAPLFLTILADCERALGNWDTATRRADEAELALCDRVVPNATNRAQRFEAHKFVRRALYGVRAKIADELGLLQIEAQWIECERECAAIANDDVSRFDVLVRQAELDLRVQRYASAEKSLEGALADAEFAKRLGRSRSKLVVRLGVARIESGDSQRGALDLETALASSDLEDAERLIAETALVESNLERREFTACAAHLDRAEELLRSVPGAGSEPEKRARQSALLAAYRTALALDRGDAADSLRAALADLDTKYAAFLDQWSRTPERAAGIGFLELGHRRMILGELVRALIRVDGDERGTRRALERILEAQSRGSIARSASIGVPPLESVANTLVPRDGGILLFLAARGRIDVFALAEKLSIAHETVVDDAALRDSMHELDDLIRSAPYARSESAIQRDVARIAELGRAVGERLITGRVRELSSRWKAAVIVGDDQLEDLGFECLRVGSSEPLGERWALGYLPSLPLGCLLESRARTEAHAEPKLALFGAPTVSARDYTRTNPIHLDERDVARLARGFAQRGPVILGAEATRAKFLSAEYDGATILELWLHGLNAPTRERPSGVLCASGPTDDGALWCDDLDFWKPARAPALVILATCSAARGPSRQGDDALAHLGGSFLSIGARCVVLSSEPVELQTTIAFLELVHAQLARGECVAEALRVARVRASSDPRFAHPFTYSMLRAVGLAHSN